MMKKVLFMLAMLTCIFASCSDGGSDEPVNPSPKPEEVKAEITIDSDIISNGLSFGVVAGEQSVSFSVNTNWTLSIASTTSGATWCKASATSGSKGTVNVKFTVDENTDYEDRSVSVTIKAGTASKTFTITQKGADALLVTTKKYEVAQKGGKIDVEVKANIDYQLAIPESAKKWIREVDSKSRALKTSKHSFEIALNEEAEKREGEIIFKSGEKADTVKVYQNGGAIIMLTQNEYTVSDAGETISVELKSNVEYGVQMPDVDWITDEASSRGMSSHTLKYVVSANEGYDSRSAEIIFYDKNSNLKDTLKVVQAQKDAIVISQKTYEVKAEGETIEVKLSANVDFEVTMPEVDWISQSESRALKEHTLYFKVAKNEGEESRSADIVFVNKESQLSEKIAISQVGAIKAGYENGIVTVATAGTMKKLLGNNYLNITSLKIIGFINGDDIYYLRKMLGASNFSETDRGKLTTLDLSEAMIVEGGEWYYEYESKQYYTSNYIIGEYMFHKCTNLENIILPENITSINNSAFAYCENLKSIKFTQSISFIGNEAFGWCDGLVSITIPANVKSIGAKAFYSCDNLNDVTIYSEQIGDRAFEVCDKLTSIIISDDVTIIGDKAFKWCYKLKSITIGNGITSIGEEAFYLESHENSKYNREVYIKDLETWCKIDFGAYSHPFYYYEGKLFLNNELLTKVSIPKSITTIKNYTFIGCSEITEVNIGDNVTKIGYCAFYNCDSLKSVTIGNGVTTIERYAFNNCESLNSVVIGKNIKTINNDAFSGVPITTFYCYSTTPPTGGPKNFKHLEYKDATLYIPARCGSTYQSQWGKYFRNIIEMD